MNDELMVGELAPDFELEGLDGMRTSLRDGRGKKVLVSFLRNAKCAICNLWVHEAEERAADWRSRGLEVVAVFESNADKLRAQFEGRRPSITVLADPDGLAHERFGSTNDPARVQALVESGAGEPALHRAAAAGFAPVREEGSNFFRVPVEILLDEAGRILLAHRADRIFDHLSVDRIEAAL